MKNNAHSVSFIGLGYVGFCTATVLATRGIRTIGIDIDSERIEKISKGQPPIHEPQLRQTLKAALKKGQFSATTETSRAADTGITFLTVGTPSKPDGSIDLTYVKKATEDLGRAIKGKKTYHLVAVKSTVTPGTASNIVKPVLETATGKSIGSELGLASNPEFLKEGSAIQDTLYPDKIVIGATDKKSAVTLKQLYKRFYKNKVPPVIETTPETAELIKYASNSFLATKVSFINTIANICQCTPGTDVETIAKAIGLDPRIGSLFLRAGPGYGGSCFHKDLQALISYSQARGYDPVLVKTTEEVNQQQAGKVVELTRTLLGNLENKRVAVLGLAFKKDTDDIREAASLRVIDQLRRHGAQVVAFDPQAMPNAKKVISAGVEFAPDPRSAIRGAEGCIIMTEWEEIRRLRPKDYLQHMKTPAIVDARKLYNPEDFRELNFVSIGLGPRNYSPKNAQNKPDSQI